MTEIKFGTSGWRAVIAEEFTFENVRRAVTGIARYVSTQKPSGARLLVGRDPRFLGETLTALAADIVAAHGIQPLLIEDPAPTPAIAYEVIRSKLDGAINFTASHNPAEYNGIKFSTPDGAPALTKVTRAIEREIAAVPDGAPPAPAQAVKARRVDVRAKYLARLKEIVDLKAIKKAKLRIAYDPLWGAARGYSDALLRDAGIMVDTLHDTRDVLFGGHAPEPDDENLAELRQRMKKGGARIGIATDGDADRFGILDADGTFLSPNYILALLFDYLVESRGWKNGAAKSVVTTSLMDDVARRHGVELHETPVGFKYIGALIQQDKVAIGGEESAGLSIRHHVPEKDGILAGLLCCEMAACRGKTLGEQLHTLFDQVGSRYPERQNFRLTPEVKEKLTAKLGEEPREFCGRRVDRIVRTDGLKLVFEDGAWLCFRPSGTEPVVRVYSEARTPQDLRTLSAAAKDWIFQ